MIEIKQFANGGLNQDVDENFLKPNDWTNALNIRNTDRLEGSDGVISNIKGNTLVTFTLPGGTNKCIGNYANELTARYYSFIYNSNGFHTITEYNNTTGVLTKVLQSKTDTGGVDILNFQPYELINGVSMIGETLLYFTDGYNPPRGIDITKAKTGTYYTDSISISLAKPPPQELITAQYGNDPSTLAASNRLKGQLFQFRYLYVYEDNTRSAWSSYSALAYPSLEIDSAVNTAAYRNNNIILNFDAGTKFVKTIEVAAQVKGVSTTAGTQDWYSILSVDRSDLITNPLYSYDSVANNATFKFYNDGLYQSVDILESDLPYDFVPLKSKTLDIVNGNVLVLGNNTEGYSNLPDDGIQLNANLSVGYIPFQSTRLGVLWGILSDVITFYGTPVAGDTIGWNYWAFWPIGSIQGSGSYTVTDDVSGSLYDTVVAFIASVNAAAGGNVVIVNPIISGFDPYLFGNMVSATVTYPNNSTSPPYTVAYSFCPPENGPTIVLNPNFSGANTAAGYKTNSRYELGLVYYDEFNRSSYVQTNNEFAVSTESWGATSGRVPVINWSVSHNPPEWATKYQWVRTEQLTHKDFLFWSASSVSANPQNAALYDLNINSLNVYDEQNPNSILAYDYTPGDRCTIHRQDGNWVSGYDVQVVGYESASGILTIQKGATLNAGASGILLEVYTPKTRANTSKEKFFFEFGVVYDCVAVSGVNKHSVSAGSFTAGDIYDKGRIISGVNYQLEDPNYSDFYVSNYSSNGRTNIFAPQAKQLTLPTDIRFSDTYVPNTNINGLSRFYGDAFETYDRVNGSIQKLAVRDNYLMTFQELKTGYIPILQSIIEDQGAGSTANVAISNKLLNKIRYFPGDYGIGTHPESFARFAGTMYFADPNRGEVLKLTQGLQPISKLGMDSYFTAKLSYTNNITNAKVLGSYDPRNDEYIVTFKYPSPTNQFPGNNQTVAFSEDINRWTSFYSFIPDCGGYIFNQFITYQNGTMWTQNTNDYYGSFYGTAYVSSVDVVYNASPSLIKTFIGVMEQASTPWTPVNIDTSTIQVSELPESSFTLKEGVYFASLLREKTGDIRSLYFGNDLKGNWIKLYLAMGSNAKQTLLSVDVRHIPSYQGIK
jgi:hypothetical protein